MAIIKNDPPPCSSCRALGDFEHDGIRYQLYFCLLRVHSLQIVDPDWPTLMARFGDGPADFKSGWSVDGNKPVLAEAERRAIEAGLYDPKKPLHPGMQHVMRLLADLLFDDVIRRLDAPDARDQKKAPLTEGHGGGEKSSAPATRRRKLTPDADDDDEGGPKGKARR